MPQLDHQERTGNYNAVLTDEQTNHSLFNGQQTRRRSMDKAKQPQAANTDNSITKNKALVQAVQEEKPSIIDNHLVTDMI
eukprot:2493625-Heterocapsa_arctica.AAC.1